MVVYEVRPQKEDSNSTRITVAGSCIYYPGNIVKPTGSLDLVMLDPLGPIKCPNGSMGRRLRHEYLDTYVHRILSIHVRSHARKLE